MNVSCPIIMAYRTCITDHIIILFPRSLYTLSVMNSVTFTTVTYVIGAM